MAEERSGCYRCSQVVVVICNVLFFLFGLLVLAAGIVAAVAMVWLNPLFDNLKDILKKTGTLLSDAGVAPDNLNLDVGGIYTGVTAGVIILGILTLILAAVGCYGACLGLKCLLISYIVFLVISMIVSIILLILQYAGPLEAWGYNWLNSALKDDYGGFDSYNLESLVWNMIMISLQCCGVQSSTDFAGATKWQKVRQVTDAAGAKTSVTLATPLVCCTLEGSGGLAGYNPPADLSCATNPTVSNSNFNTGCWDKLVVFYKMTQPVGIGVGVSFILIQALLLCLTIYLLWTLTQSGKRSAVRARQTQGRTMYMPDMQARAATSSPPNRKSHKSYPPELPYNTHQSAIATPDWYSPERRYDRAPAFSPNNYPDGYYYGRGSTR